MHRPDVPQRLSALVADGGGVSVFFVGHRGNKFPSTALMDPMTSPSSRTSTTSWTAHGLDRCTSGRSVRTTSPSGIWPGSPPGRGSCTSGAGAGESGGVAPPRSAARPDGTSYAWLVKTSAMVNHFYFYCIDEDFGPFFLKFCTYFPLTPSCASTATNGSSGNWPRTASALRPWTTASSPATTRRAASDLRHLGPRSHRRLAAQVAEDPAASFHRGRHRGGLPTRCPSCRRSSPSPRCWTSRSRDASSSTQVIRRQPRHRPPDQVPLVFGRKIIRKGRHPTPGRFRTRIITDGVMPSLHVSYKNNRDQAIPQARPGAPDRDHHQRHPRLRHRQAAA